MKSSRRSRFRMLGVALSLAASVSAGPVARGATDDAPQSLLDLMAEGKTETDLGHFDLATRLLTSVIESADAPPVLRAEALVRLGAARRGAGDEPGALAAFESAAKEPGLDAERKALLVRALGGVVPGNDRWAQIWTRVSFRAEPTPLGRQKLAIVWPDVLNARHAYQGVPISLHFQDGDLQDIFRLMADVSGLNVVVAPGTRGQANLKLDKVPWDDMLDRILAANGLAYRLDDNVLLIGNPDFLGPDRPFNGARVDLDWGPDADQARPGRGRDLREALIEVAAWGQATVDLDPAIQGGVILKLWNVRWDQAFDTIVRVNGLHWTRSEGTLKVFPRP